MPNVVHFRPGSEDLEQMLKGWVDARRINDIVARPDTKRYRSYLRIVQEQFVDPHVMDPDEAWRHKELLPRALEAYERRHGVTVTQGRLWTLPDFKIAAAPDATEGRWGLTVHVRQTLETYREACRIGITPEMQRVAQAMMWVTGRDAWIHLQYFEDAQLRKRALTEQEIAADIPHQEQLGEAMIGFYSKSRLRAAI